MVGDCSETIDHRHLSGQVRIERRRDVPRLKHARPRRRDRARVAVEPGVTLTEGEKAAYDAPFPSDIYRTGPRSLPSMASLANEEAELRAWESIQQFEKPFLTVFGELDPLIGGPQHQSRLIDNIPGAKGQPHDRILAGHFVQESAGEEVAQRLNAFIAANVSGLTWCSIPSASIAAVVSSIPIESRNW